ncbi:MAG: putative lipid II flippase FtsW, partial [Caldilineae bacterium]
AVSVALAPPTGIPLPFVSLGGSSLVTSMGAAGLLLSIGRYGPQAPGSGKGGTNRATFDLRWGHRRPRVPSPRRRRTAANRRNSRSARR